MRSRHLVACVACVVVAVALAPLDLAVAGFVWIDRGDVPLAEWAQSVEVLRDDEALVVSPGGSRRGLVAAGVRLPLLGATRGPGCLSRWYLVGPLAYVCSDRVHLSADPPGVDPSIHPFPADALPYRYFFVGRDGADAFAKLADIDDDSPAEQLDRGWSVAGVGESRYGGASYVKTRRGRLIPRAQLGAVAPYAFHGEDVAAPTGVTLGLGWVLPDKAPVFADAKSTGKKNGTRTRLQVVTIVETKKVGKETWHAIAAGGGGGGPGGGGPGGGADGGWMRATDVRAPTLAAPPDDVGEAERWIDIDLATQTLATYEGRKPLFATVISAGRAPGSTPRGVFRIWVKLRSATMSNADDPSPAEESTPESMYSIEDVPWVQYFSKGVALHGAFWHRKFGAPHSHGCVNLAPLDAMKVFDWTLPRLPRGWDAAFPTVAEPATVVRVR